MAVTLQELEQRLAAVEAELARLRAGPGGTAREGQPSPQAPRPGRKPGERLSILTDPLDVVIEELRRRGVPLTVQELRAMQAEEGRRRAASRDKRKGNSRRRPSRRQADPKGDE